jgi:hypothetical protein
MPPGPDVGPATAADPINPALSNVLFRRSWTEAIVGTVGTASRTVTYTVTRVGADPAAAPLWAGVRGAGRLPPESR